MSDVERAREILRRERETILQELREAGEEARAAAAAQKSWRAKVATLLDRGKAAEISVVEMARALGVSRQWATHLLSPEYRGRRLRKVLASPAMGRAIEEQFRRGAAKRKRPDA